MISTERPKCLTRHHLRATSTERSDLWQDRPLDRVRQVIRRILMRLLFC